MPDYFGQWEGPYNLQPWMEPEREIAHAIYLPAGVYAGHVMLWNWPGPGSPVGTFTPRTYLWDPGNPTRLTAEPYPAPTDGSQDFFCAGHSLLGNGDIVTAGGQDLSMTSQIEGIPWSFRFDAATGQWQLPQDMQGSRYYPSTLRVRDDVHVLGHTWFPQFAEEVAIVRSPAGTFSTRPNEDWFDASSCGSPGLVGIHDYAKVVHLAVSDTVMWLDAEYLDPQNEERHASWFLPLQEEPCGSSPPGQLHRWQRGGETTHPATHAGGGSAHLVFTDTSGDATSEVVYILGGTEHGLDDNNLCPTPVGSKVTAEVERMSFTAALPPAVTQAYLEDWDTSVADMNMQRFNANCVVLLDGSLLVVGGLGPDPLPTGNCTFGLRPERYEPEEVFGPDHVTTWRMLAPQIEQRGYHSVAALLPDGSVLSAGGKGPDSSKYSIEVYRPAYMFRPRPEIDPDVPTVWQYGNEVIFNVTLPITTGSGVGRVALLTPTSTTHTTHFDQRYIQLWFEVIAGPTGSPPQQTIGVVAPASNLEAPAGYYLLAVVDENDIPSVAKVIRLQ